MATSAVYLKYSSPENSWKLSALLKTSGWPHHLHRELERQPTLQFSTAVTEANIKRIAYILRSFVTKGCCNMGMPRAPMQRALYKNGLSFL